MTTSLPRSVSHVPDLDPETRFSIEASILVRGSFPIAQSTVIDASLDTLPLMVYFGRWTYGNQAH
jgi:hypothetical protein